MNVLFVCTGNTCRSALAEAILHRHGLAGVTVESAGTGASDGDRASEKSCRVAKEHGLDLRDHRARRRNESIVKTADRILTMTKEHRKHVADMGIADEEHLHVLGEFAGRTGSAAKVEDPMDEDSMEAYRATYAQLDEMITAILPRLAQNGGNQRMPERDPYQGVLHRFAYYKGELFRNEEGGGNAACIEDAQKETGSTWAKMMEENDLVQGAYGYEGDEVVAHLWKASLDDPDPAGFEAAARAKFETDMLPKKVQWLRTR